MPEPCVTFDYDTTLAISLPDENLVWVYKRPNTPIVNELRRRLARGERVFIVTQRVEKDEHLPDRRSVQSFLDEQGLQPAGVVFTNGAPKASFLVALGSVLHFDDNPDEARGLPPSIEFRLVNDGLAPRPGTWFPSGE
jgi:hypothetical protein